MQVKKAIIPLGGLSTRFLPEFKSIRNKEKYLEKKFWKL